MFDHGITWGILAVVNIPLYLFFGKQIFSDWEGFGEAIGYLLSPDILDTLNGERTDNFYAKFKFLIFIALCGACVYGEFHLTHKYLLH